MREFWDARAREDARYFIYNQLPYRRGRSDDFWASGEHDLAALLEATGTELRPDDAVVEIGCGIGRMTRAIRARARSVRAIDVSAEMIERARAENAELDGVEWIVGDGATLAGIADASADAVLSHVVFQHVPDPEITYGYVTEIGRVLGPGGWAAFQVSTDPAIHAPRRRGPLARTAWLARVALGRAPRGQADPAWLGSAVEIATLRERAEQAGMQVEQVRGEGTQFCFVRLRR
jgi:SAM-dependent methyltransferase